MKKFLIVFISFYFLFLLSIDLSYAIYFDFPLFQDEQLITVYKFEDLIYVLSQKNNYLILRTFNNDDLINLSTNYFDGQILKVKFIEKYDAFYIAVVTKNDQETKLKILNTNFEIIREMLVSNQNLDLISFDYLQNQDKFIFIFKGSDDFKIVFINPDNSLQEIFISSSPKEKFQKKIFNNFYTLLTFYNEAENRYRSFVYNRRNNLIYTSNLPVNFKLFDLAEIGNNFYFCGRDENNKFSLIKLNINNFHSDYFNYDNIKISNQLYCRYLEGDLNDLLILFDDQNFEIKLINSNIALELPLSYFYQIKNVYLAEPEVFGGRIRMIYENPYRTIFSSINIFDNQDYFINNFSDFKYIDSFYNNLEDKILMILQKDRRGKIYSDFSWQ
jgi:hypothetical protein